LFEILAPNGFILSEKHKTGFSAKPAHGMVDLAVTVTNFACVNIVARPRLEEARHISLTAWIHTVTVRKVKSS